MSYYSPSPAEDQGKLLDEILNVCKVQAHQMKKCLVKKDKMLQKEKDDCNFFLSGEILGK